MKFRIEPHTMERAEERGAGEQDIIDVITTGFSIPAKGQRHVKAKVYDFENVRHGKY